MTVDALLDATVDSSPTLSRQRLRSCNLLAMRNRRSMRRLQLFMQRSMRRFINAAFDLVTVANCSCIGYATQVATNQPAIDAVVLNATAVLYAALNAAFDSVTSPAVHVRL